MIDCQKSADSGLFILRPSGGVDWKRQRARPDAPSAVPEAAPSMNFLQASARLATLGLQDRRAYDENISRTSSAAATHTTAWVSATVTTTATAATTDAHPRVRTRSLGCGSGASNAPSNAAPAANRVIRHGSATSNADVTATIVAHAGTVAYTARTPPVRRSRDRPIRGVRQPQPSSGWRHPDLCAAGLGRRQAWPSTMQNPSTPRYLTLPAPTKAAFILGPGMLGLHARQCRTSRRHPHNKRVLVKQWLAP